MRCRMWLAARSSCKGVLCVEGGSGTRLRDPALRTGSGFAAFARLTVIAAERLQGQGSAVASAVKNAWDNVGVPTEQPALQSLTAH